MSVYKDTNRNTWYSKFQYNDWKGEQKWVTKRGFKTKREATEWETQFKLDKAGSLDMTFEEFANRYKEDRFPRLKPSTRANKSNIIDKHLIPYFGNMKVRDIGTKEVMMWQNEIIKYRDPKTGNGFKSPYLKSIHSQLSAMLNHAVKFFDLKSNPAQKVGNMGSNKGIELNFWTKDEYMRFAEVAMEKPEAYYAFETLYWTGIREGELLALTLEDVDFEKSTIRINKTYQIVDGEEIIGTPKTVKSNRTIVIPDFLCEELRDYVGMLYQVKPKDRIFPRTKWFLSHNLDKYGQIAGLKHIRVHDLRHSHVSLLIDMGYSAVAIADRVGHESVEITYRYAHLFPSVQKDMAGKLNMLREVSSV